MKILVPIDGSEFSKHSIEFVTSRATLLGHNPEIELLSVQAPVPARASKLIGNGSLSGYYDEEANVILEPAIEALKLPASKQRLAMQSAKPPRQSQRLPKNPRRPDHHGLPRPLCLEGPPAWFGYQFRFSALRQTRPDSAQQTGAH